MTRYLNFFITLVLIFGLTACGDYTSSGPFPDFDHEVPMEPERRDAYLRHFPLLDATGVEGPPVVPQLNAAPVGVILKLPKDGQITVCTITHLKYGKAATNAHCVSNSPNWGAKNFFIVFYTKDGRRVFTPGASFQYIGDRNADDVAIINLPKEAAEQWDTVDGRVVGRSQTVGRRPAPSERVSVWAFDPFEAHADVVARYGKTGMIFQPRNCLASRTLPVLLGVRENGQAVNILENTTARESLHTFVDGCDRHLVHGNSGSLISILDRMQEMLGVYHWGIAPTPAASFNRFRYVGNDNNTKEIYGKPASGEFFGVGYAFENLVLNGFGPF